MLAILAFENLKSLPIYANMKQYPQVKFLEHLRNASAHGNKFHFYHPEKLTKSGEISWRGKMIDKNLQGKNLFPDFFSYGDFGFLFHDISELIFKAENNV